MCYCNLRAFPDEQSPGDLFAPPLPAEPSPRELGDPSDLALDPEKEDDDEDNDESGPEWSALLLFTPHSLFLLRDENFCAPCVRGRWLRAEICTTLTPATAPSTPFTLERGVPLNTLTSVDIHPFLHGVRVGFTGPLAFTLLTRDPSVTLCVLRGLYGSFCTCREDPLGSGRGGGSTEGGRGAVQGQGAGPEGVAVLEMFGGVVPAVSLAQVPGTLMKLPRSSLTKDQLLGYTPLSFFCIPLFLTLSLMEILQAGLPSLHLQARLVYVCVCGGGAGSVTGDLACALRGGVDTCRYCTFT